MTQCCLGCLTLASRTDFTDEGHAFDLQIVCSIVAFDQATLFLILISILLLSIGAGPFTKMKDKILFSIVTVNWNRCVDLSELLESLRLQRLKNFEVIVVDNGSIDDSVRIVSRDYPEAKLISLRRNIGVTGFNIGVKHALGKYVIFLDNDTLISPDFTQKANSLIRQYPGFSAYALNIVQRDGKSQPDYLPGDIEAPVEWHNFIGGGVIFSALDYNELHGYDPKYFVYINETELAARICLTGRKILFCPQLKVIHKTSPVARLSEVNYFYFVRNSILFMKTYFRFLQRWNLLVGFLIINLRYSLQQGITKTYLRAILEGWSTVPSHKPPHKLGGQLAKKFSESWQGNPAFTEGAKRQLWKKFK